MTCVYFENTLPNGFEERFVFSPEMPYTINIKHFQADDIVPLHYAETIEILLCDGLRGELSIGGNRYALQGRQLFAVPAYTLHSNSIRSGQGSMYVFKASPHHMQRYINLENYLNACGCSADRLAYCYPAEDYGDAFRLMRLLIDDDGDLPRCLIHVQELFLLLSRHTEKSRDASPQLKLRDTSLQELITWTQENYHRKITVDEAARRTGYSKYHFCSRFKSLTGLTYLTYLNSVRISHACLMLARGDNVQTVCRTVGFENVSYFIQVFKKIQHMTPRQYACEQRQMGPRFVDSGPGRGV